MISNLQTSLTPQPQTKFKFDSRGRVSLFNEKSFSNVFPKPITPPRPKSSFILFAEDYLKIDNPNVSVFFQVTQETVDKWRELDQQTKAYYEAKSQETHAVFAEYVALYEATNGKMEKK